MANIFKFRVTNKVEDKTIGIGIGNYSAGDTIYLNEKQVNQAQIRNNIQKGYLEPAGEDDSLISEEMMDYYNGSQQFNKNYLPVSSVELVQPLAAAGQINIQANDLSGNLSLNKRVAIDKLFTRFSAASVTETMPKLLVSAGEASPVTPTLLTGYDNTAGTYTAATNGSIAVNAPFVWAANDMLIVGYSEKFSSVVCDMTTANSNATSATAYYWNGTEWVEFTSFNDYTEEVATMTLSRVSAGDKTRMVWWEKPDAWVAGGPTGSGATDSMYCVAIKFSGVLTALAGGSVYPVLDTPIADISLGYGEFAPEAVTLKLGAAYSDIIAAAPATLTSFTTTDYIWLGFSKKVSGFYVDVTATNANNVTAVLTYWNGQAWTACPAVTDGTNAGLGTFAQDGTITMANIPADWQTIDAASTNVTGTNTPATTSTDSLYWLRYTVSGAMDAVGVTATVNRGVPGLNYWYEYETVDQTYVDANDDIHVVVVEPENTIAGLTVQAVIDDI